MNTAIITPATPMATATDTNNRIVNSNLPPCQPPIIQPYLPYARMDALPAWATAAGGSDERHGPPFNPKEKESHIDLKVRLATDIMLDILLKPKTSYVGTRDLLEYSSSLPLVVRSLVEQHRKKLLPRLQFLGTAFGPGIFTSPKFEEAFTKFEEDYDAAIEVCSLEVDSGIFLFNMCEELNGLFADIVRFLDNHRDICLDFELAARYDVELRDSKRRRPSPDPYNVLFFQGKFGRVREIEQPLFPGQLGGLHTSKTSVYEPFSLRSIPEVTIRQRLLDEAFRARSNDSDKFSIFRLLTRRVRKIKKTSPYNTQYMDLMVSSLAYGYRPGGLAGMGHKIDRQALTIIIRFGIGYFSAKDSGFNKFIGPWAQRYCKVADEALEKSMDNKTWAHEVGKVMFALLKFLMVSHDALLENYVDEKLPATIKILYRGNLEFRPATSRFSISRGRICMVNKSQADSREQLKILMNNNKIAAALGEIKDELVISFKDLTLPHDYIELPRRKVLDGWVSSDDDEDDDEMFPPLRVDSKDHIDALWYILQSSPSTEGESSAETQREGPIMGKVVKMVSKSSGKVEDRFITVSISPVSSQAGSSSPAHEPQHNAAVQSNRDEVKGRSNLESTNIISSKVNHDNRRSAENLHGGSGESSGTTEHTIKHLRKRNIHPRARLNAYLNDPTINIFSSLPTSSRPGDPLFLPRVDVRACVKSLAEAKASENLTQAQPQATHQAQQETFEASKEGRNSMQLLDTALATELNIHPKWPAKVLEVGRPCGKGWSSQPIAAPEGLSSSEGWTIEWSEKRANEYNFSDEGFDVEMKDVLE
ncbi:uncharacterized protein RSE6_01691 [Rhynchosporium secalis]|uniref:Uncharacterized protein n=1 Tax=Rhynchosporium secalis TaxID=38038 RepID=A0A1E1LYG1_RHYSE|nr:uncharacterized protein RSE6_01691 [Rhynchosporium secalis]